ncbi:transcriptional regulator [Siminovitchia terrae]|uniref:DUF1232 domain-containing protein n=2 Tax=Siminovitchia terrae TaxID=1914933 RepID=A0A429X3J1_SIMTE|nr:DUF1232 domain-containing protein [Siminovitchia terrae]RST57947.1 DUF1232 domain-containing protein [Siminovitchia terrae]GIN91077.1 transcriptional regulator [Siminovitchia terrae]
MSTSNNKNQNLGELLKALLKKRSLSMRKLSLATGIDTATISRIANNKQQAKPSHIKLFSQHLQVPEATLLQSAGYDVEITAKGAQNDMYDSINSINEVLVSSKFLGDQFNIVKVHEELAKYEQYALTEEGKQKILKEFKTKVEEVKGAGPFINELKKMHKSFCEEDISIEKRSIIGGVLLYFISSTDIIPDYVFPFGYLDDAIAVQIIIERLKKIEDLSKPNDEHEV